MPDANPTLSDDLLYGANSIASFVGHPPRTVYHLLETGQLPGAFKLGKRWCLRKSTFLRNIVALERGEQPDAAAARDGAT